MRDANNEKRKTTYDKNRTTKPRKISVKWKPTNTWEYWKQTQINMQK